VIRRIARKFAAQARPEDEAHCDPADRSRLPDPAREGAEQARRPEHEG
jgi:hypothetical protein